MVMIEGEWPTLASRAPQPDGSSPVVIYVDVEDVDNVIERAVAAGARVDHLHARRRDFGRGEGAAVVQHR
jgi:uncharacterized glyoxalase superfamily protein PhnB